VLTIKQPSDSQVALPHLKLAQFVALKPTKQAIHSALPTISNVIIATRLVIMPEFVMLNSPDKLHHSLPQHGYHHPNQPKSIDTSRNGSRIAITLNVCHQMCHHY